jgi:signal transduction histidine kinase
MAGSRPRGTVQQERAHAEWTAAVAHDLRQPATNILLGTELLLEEPLDEPHREILRRMRAAAEYLTRLVEDITDAASVDTGRVALRFHDVELATLVQELADREVWRRSIAVHVPRSSTMVRCDPDRVRQILENLLSNAVKYGDPASIAVTVEIVGRFAQVTVSNRGHGILPDEVTTVFERYGRTRRAAASSTKGSGLGLFIAKGLVEAQGGQLWVESVPDETTHFHATLPLSLDSTSYDAFDQPVSTMFPYGDPRD